MRFLPALLIALTLLPLSAALKCYSGMVVQNARLGPAPHGDIKSAKEDCPASVKYCAVLEAKQDGTTTQKGTCDSEGDCKGDGMCESMNEDGVVGLACCCLGSLCNGAPIKTKSTGAPGGKPGSKTDSNGPKSEGSNPKSDGKPKDDSKDSKSGESNLANAPTALLSLAAAAAVLAARA